jgi:hypothetical protein
MGFGAPVKFLHQDRGAGRKETDNFVSAQSLLRIFLSVSIPGDPGVIACLTVKQCFGMSADQFLHFWCFLSADVVRVAFVLYIGPCGTRFRPCCMQYCVGFACKYIYDYEVRQ